MVMTTDKLPTGKSAPVVGVEPPYITKSTQLVVMQEEGLQSEGKRLEIGELVELPNYQANKFIQRGYSKQYRGTMVAYTVLKDAAAALGEPIILLEKELAGKEVESPPEPDDDADLKQGVRDLTNAGDEDSDDDESDSEEEDTTKPKAKKKTNRKKKK